MREVPVPIWETIYGLSSPLHHQKLGRAMMKLNNTQLIELSTTKRGSIICSQS